MGQRSTKRTPIRKVTSAEEQQERAELAKYRASLRRIRAIERTAKQLRRLRQRANGALHDLAVDFGRAHGFEFVAAVRNRAVNE